MNIELRKNIDFELKDIFAIKSYTYELTNKTNDSIVLSISLAYQDKSNQDCFKTLSKQIDLMLIDVDITSLEIKSLKLYVIEDYGVTADVELTISEAEKEKKVEDVIQEDFIINDEAEDALEPIVTEEPKKNDVPIEPIKEEIKNNLTQEYENILKESLQERTVITTQNGNADDFLSFFNNKLNSYYSLKCIKVSSERELDEISKEYQVSVVDLLKGYDKDNGRVIFRVNK